MNPFECTNLDLISNILRDRDTYEIEMNLPNWLLFSFNILTINFRNDMLYTKLIIVWCYCENIFDIYVGTDTMIPGI